MCLPDTIRPKDTMFHEGKRVSTEGSAKGTNLLYKNALADHLGRASRRQRARTPPVLGSHSLLIPTMPSKIVQVLRRVYSHLRRCRKSTMPCHQTTLREAPNYGGLSCDGEVFTTRASRRAKTVQNQGLEADWIEGDMLKARIESKIKEYDNYLTTGLIPRFTSEGQAQVYIRS